MTFLQKTILSNQQRCVKFCHFAKKSFCWPKVTGMAVEFPRPIRIIEFVFRFTYARKIHEINLNKKINLCWLAQLLVDPGPSKL